MQDPKHMVPQHYNHFQLNGDSIKTPQGPSSVLQAGRQVISGVFAVAAANADPKCQKVFQRAGQLVDQFYEGLDNLLGGGPRRLRDTEFIRLTEWCSYHGRKEYGKRPRTLAVLRWAGCPDAIEGFVSANLSDYSLPYTERNLPLCVKSQPVRSKFIELQHYVLTTQANNLEDPKSPHLNMQRSSADKFFDILNPLGSGGFGNVFHVVSRLSLKQYALKCIPRGQSFNRDQVQMQSFTNEVQALKVLSHKHLVKLVGSYTDQEHIGLLMTPVADMNLATYLMLPDSETPGRSACIRNFFGCLAAGVEHLHAKRIKHKDIKPLNVLVLMRTGRVLLADFGTSRNWADDGSSSSHGTVQEAYTERYCAPEVANRARRNWSSDIWSLGCIYLEMSSVLAGFTIQQMQQFFESNGNGRQFIRENPIALRAWCDRISRQVSLPSDQQVLELTKRMCHPDPIERPTASQIAAEIVDFSGPVKYHCGCCQVNNADWLNADVVKDMQNITKTEEWDPTRSKTLQPATSGSSDGSGLSTWSIYQAPNIQEIQEDMTVLHYDADGQAICTPRATEGQMSDGVPSSQFPSADMPLMTENEDYQESSTPLDQLDLANVVYCYWPDCSATWPVDEQDPFIGHLLCQHYRSVHGSHEFGPHFWLFKPTEDTQDPRDHSSECLEVLTYPDSSIDSTDKSNETDPIVAAIYAKRLERREKRAQEATVRAAAPAPPASDSRPELPPVATAGAVGAAAAALLNRVRSRSVRFDKLPDDRRPEVTLPPSSSPTMDEDLDIRLHVENARLCTTWPFLTRMGSIGDEDVSVSPESSFVPSYHLAASNRFSRQEIDRALMSDARPYFVYGTLMFPSILKACATFYRSGTGVYAPHLQRRLQTTGIDWAFANVSVESAAQCMTPAVMKAGIPTKVLNSPGAMARLDRTDNEVHGFLVFGLSQEAYRCIDHWLNQEMPARCGYKPHASGVQEFQRHEVVVEVQQTDSKNRVVLANTFGSLMPTSRSRSRSIRPDQVWDRNSFARSQAFDLLCEDGWMKEEKKLAHDMKMRCLMRGDILAIAVLEQDLNKIRDILDEEGDIDARCHQYGTPLQAAAAKGYFEIVEELVSRGANVNATNGSYGCPLVAACVHGHNDIVRYLLRNQANVLTEGGRHINALYQAVSFSDLELAHILLEKGAWLTPNYKEILDLAEETGSRDMSRMLEDYDVRNLHKERSITYEPEREHSRSRTRRTSSSSSMTYIPYEERLAMDKGRSSGLLQAVMLEALSLRGKTGKWTGIKAVRVLRKALAKGAPPSIIDKVAPHLKDYGTLIDWLNKAQREFTQDQDQNQTLGAGPSTGNDLLDHVLQQPRSRSRRLTDVTSSSSERPPDPRRDSGVDLTNITCLSCRGRGGKEGTERSCRNCAGSGSGWQRNGPHSRRVACVECRGRGHNYSRRDICYECNGEGITRHVAINPESRVQTLEQVDEPPPPYTAN